MNGLILLVIAFFLGDICSFSAVISHTIKPAYEDHIFLITLYIKIHFLTANKRQFNDDIFMNYTLACFCF